MRSTIKTVEATIVLPLSLNIYVNTYEQAQKLRMRL